MLYEVIDTINDKRDWSILPIMGDILDISKSFYFIKFAHIFGTSNVVAHRSVKSEFVWVLCRVCVVFLLLFFFF